MTLEASTKQFLRSAIGNNAAANEVITALNVVDGVTAIAAEITAKTDGQPATATFAVAAGSTNVAEVTITVKDGNGVAVTTPVILDILLSDAATGLGLTATTASGAVAAKASSGTDLSTLVSKKALKVQTLANGTYVLSITDSAKTGFYVVANIPGQKPAVSSALVTGNYG